MPASMGSKADNNYSMNAMTAGEQAALPMVKSLLSRLRIPGTKAVKHDVKAVVADSTAGKQSDQELGGRWAASPFALGQGLPPAEQCTSGSTPTPAPAARAPSLSAFSTPQPQNAGNHPTAQRAGGGAPGAVATPTPTTAVPRFHDQQQYLAAAQEAQQQQRRPPPLQLQPCVGGAGAGGACGVPLAAHASMDAPLPQQHSWGSPRSSDMQRSVSSSDTVAALMQEAQALQSGGGAAGSAHGRSSGGGRPSGVPPLNLARVGIASAAAAAAPPAAPHHDRAAAGPGGAGAAAGADSHSALQAGVAELEQELAGWAAAPQWQPSSQGRWYVYPPIGRKDVAPVEALVSTLTPAQAAEVAVLWRQYAAARYSAELMAGRAVRLCRELTRELANSRAHTGHVAEQGAEHAEKLGQTIKSLQQQLDEARHAAAAAAAAAPAMHGNSSAHTCSSCRQPQAQQQQPQPAQSASAAPAAPAAAVNDYLASPTRHHASAAMAMAAPAIGAGLTPVGALRVPVPAPARPQLEVSACKAAARQQGNGATRGSMAAAAVGLLDTDDGYSYSSCSSSPGRPEDLAARLHTQHTQHAQQQGQQRAAAGPGGAEALRALAQENEELLDQLEHMRGLFLEAHADGRALREALEDVDAECAALRQHGSGLGRQAAAVLAENTSLRVEVEGLRAALLASQQQQQRQQQQQHQQLHVGVAGAMGPGQAQQPVAPLHGPHAPAHIPRPPPGSAAASGTTSRTPLATAAAAAGGSGGTPLTAPRPPVAGMASAAAYAAGVATNTWTPPPVIGLAVPSTAAPGTGAGPHSGRRTAVLRTAATEPRSLAPQQQEQLQRPAAQPYFESRLGGGGSSSSSGGGGISDAGAGQVARTLAHALETEGAVAVVHAVPAVASSSGVGSLQVRALSRSGSASALAAAPLPHQHHQQSYVQQRQQQAAEQGRNQQQQQLLLHELAW